jgi:hypothetical protein
MAHDGVGSALRGPLAPGYLDIIKRNSFRS